MLIRYWIDCDRTQATRLPEGVSDHSGHVHDHVGRSNTDGLYVHVYVGRQSVVGQQNGTDGVTDEQHQKDILVRVLRASRATAGQSSPMEEDAARTPHHRGSTVLILHHVLTRWWLARTNIKPVGIFFNQRRTQKKCSGNMWNAKYW